jgi:hypothetical protein
MRRRAEPLQDSATTTPTTKTSTTINHNQNQPHNRNIPNNGSKEEWGEPTVIGGPTFARKKEWHPLCKLIEMSDYEELEKRSLKVIKAAGYVPTKEPRTVFGRKFFRSSEGGDQATYYSKLRSFLKFHLMYPEYDSGIAIFYPFTDVNTVVGCELAAAHFLQMQFAEVDQVVIDYQVCENARNNVAMKIFSSWIYIAEKNGDGYAGRQESSLDGDLQLQECCIQLRWIHVGTLGSTHWSRVCHYHGLLSGL